MNIHIQRILVTARPEYACACGQKELGTTSGGFEIH